MIFFMVLPPSLEQSRLSEVVDEPGGKPVGFTPNWLCSTLLTLVFA